MKFHPYLLGAIASSDYMAIRTSDPATREQLAYARTLIREANHHGGLGWLDYDWAFRQQAAVDHSLHWNTVSTIFGQQSGEGTFYTLCKGVDHVRAQCALSVPSATYPKHVYGDQGNSLT